MAKKQGTNIKPAGGTGGGKQLNPIPDPAHPGQQLPASLPGGPYYKQKGANGK